ncbi:unnamed protein product [Allacma fusca]|uniref:Uncharacterized protein n=1 Tax=Allacma fusca TaxID=39272 RepID=A0A8J2PDC9_9HEXA|nr:unnamed protein product [Allacma fusca]
MKGKKNLYDYLCAEGATRSRSGYQKAKKVKAVLTLDSNATRGGDDMHNIGVGIYDLGKQQAALKLGVVFSLTSDLDIPPEQRKPTRTQAL